MPRQNSALPLLLLFASCGADEVADNGSSSPKTRLDYVSSQTCALCHGEQHERWRDSHHDLAMQEASEETVLGDFDDATFEEAGRVARFFRRGEEFWVNTEGPEGTPDDFRVAYTFGVDPLQQYLVEFPGGRYQSLDIGWDVAGQRWFDVLPATQVDADDEYHWTGRFQSWNLQCADCHSTFFEKNYDAKSDTYSSTWKEIDVGCEACHGAGSEHVRLARTWSEEGRPENAPSGFLSDLRKDDPEGIINSCAACHSRRTAITAAHEPGTRFEDDYRLATLSPDLYYADGQIRDEVYVLGSFLQSKMHQRGVSCIDCHDPHGLELWLPADGSCLQCHSPEAPLDRFPTLQQKLYADPSHHFHPQESEAARCVSCHMPETNYMVIDPRRDHSLRIPRPDLTLSVGSPNACNGCHQDQSAEWAAETIAEWYGHEATPHYGEALGSTLTQDSEAIKSLMALPFDQEAPGIVRASAIDRFPEGSQVSAQAAVMLLREEESDTLLKVEALGGLLDSQPQLLVALVPPLLKDPSRLVRIEAAHVLAGPAEAQLDEAQRKDFEAAFQEFVDAQLVNGDAPFAHLNLAVVHERRGRMAEARAAYRRALELDSGFLPAIFNLATLLSSEGKHDAAETLLRGAIEEFPTEGELHYSLGLLLAGSGDLEGSAKALEAAVRYMPDRPRIQYNLGLAYSQTGRKQQAEGALLRAHRSDPKDADFLYALATFYLEQDDLERALEYSQQLCDAVPQAQGPLQLRHRIQERIAAGE